MREAQTPRRKRTFGVFIGRFQPPHLAHQQVMLEALESVKKLILVLGSSRSARSTKNPFTAQERKQMLLTMLGEAGIAKHRLLFVEVRDYFYNEALWLSEVQKGVQAHTQGSSDLALIGHIKDESSYYLRSFPAWEFLPTNVESSLSATDVRRAAFEGNWEQVSQLVPSSVKQFLREFETTLEFEQLRQEYQHLEEYRSAWQNSPFPPVFVTTDAVVVRSGHVLLVRRAGPLGRGKLAMPGGFIEQNESLLSCCIRELREETGLGQHLPLEQQLKASAVFDYPERSQRGRTITHAYHFDLGIGHLPELQAGSDAAKAFWLPISDVLAQPELFFEDHHAIIEHFLMRG